MDSMPPVRFVTASLQVDYLAPTPQGVELVLRGSLAEINQKKVIVEVSLQAGGRTCARGRVVAVRMPESMVANRGAER
jgi:acyl-coenzyme A thioesterase PaaI-like protein